MKTLPAVALLLFALALNGCAIVPGQRMDEGALQREDSHMQLVQITPELVESSEAQTSTVPQELLSYQPEDYRIIRAILGHATGATADKHYNRAKGIGAARVFQAAVIERRKTLTPCHGMYSVPTQSGLP